MLDLNAAGAEDRLMRQFPRGLDAAFDCAGRAETLGQALRLTRRGASILLTAIFPEQVSIPMVQLQRAERQLIGVQLYQRGDFEAVLRLLENKRLDLSGVVTHAYPLERTADAFGLLLSPEAPAGKVLIRLDGGTLGA